MSAIYYALRVRSAVALTLLSKPEVVHTCEVLWVSFCSICTTWKVVFVYKFSGCECVDIRYRLVKLGELGSLSHVHTYNTGQNDIAF